MHYILYNIFFYTFDPHVVKPLKMTNSAHASIQEYVRRLKVEKQNTFK